MTPYYADGAVTIWHGDCREIPAWRTPIHRGKGVIVTDPPYGIAYQSGQFGTLPRSIEGDEDTSLRDWVLDLWSGPALVFGTWRRPRPAATRMVLIWDTKGALGMGDLSLPWKPAHQEIYVIGSGFTGHRGNDVLTIAPVQSTAVNGRVHPHQKPVELMTALIEKCPPNAPIVDPFMGSGSTLVAAKSCGRRAIGVEIDERYCEIAAKRCAQGVLWEAS